jgi:O-antigen ligase
VLADPVLPGRSPSAAASWPARAVPRWRTVTETVAPAAIIAFSFLLNAQAVHGHYTVPVMLLVSAAALCSRYALLAWLVCSTVTPDPPGDSLTNTQGLLLCLAGGMLALYPWYLEGVRWLALAAPAAMGLALAIASAIGLVVHADWVFGWELAKTGLAVGLLAVVLAHRDLDFHKAAIVCAAAGLVATAGYWMDLAGVASVAEEHIGDSVNIRGVLRITSGKADPNALGLVLGAFVAAGLWLLVGRHRPRRLLVLGLAAVLLGMPAIIFTCSRGTALAVPIVLAAALAVYGRHVSLGWSLVWVAAGAALAIAEAVPGPLAEKVAEFHAFALDRGIAGRIEYWSDGLRTVLQYPLLGFGYEAYLARHGMVPHNTLLDFGLFGGLPALLALAGTWAVGFWRLARRPVGAKEADTGALLLVLYATNVVLAMTLSMATNKLVWAYWLMIWMWTYEPRRGGARPCD